MRWYVLTCDSDCIYRRLSRQILPTYGQPKVEDPFVWSAPQAPSPTREFFPRDPLVFQEPLLLYAALLQIHPNHQQHRARQSQREQEVERRGVVPVRRRIYDGARHQRPDERGRLADDGEEREEQKLFAPRRDLGDHNLRIRIPRADKKTVEGLVDPNFPQVVEAEVLRPDAYHAPSVAA